MCVKRLFFQHFTSHSYEKLSFSGGKNSDEVNEKYVEGVVARNNTRKRSCKKIVVE